MKLSSNNSLFKKIGGVQTVISLCVLVMLALVPPVVNNAFVTSLLTTVFIYIILSESWNVIGGYAGLFSLGQNIFYGVTAYCMVLFTSKLGLPIILGFLAGICINVILAIVIGFISDKVKDLFFSVLTLAVAQILLSLVNTWYDVTNGTRGAALGSEYIVSGQTAYYIGLAMVVITIAAVLLMTKSKMGNYLIAIRENEDLVKSLGINTVRWKIIASILSAVIASLASVVMVFQISIVYPNATFAFDVTTKILVISMVGGKGDIRGPIYGSVIIIINQLLRGWLGGQYAALPGVIYGLIMIAIVLLLPDGVAGVLHGRHGKHKEKRGESVAVQS